MADGDELALAQASRDTYQERLSAAGFGRITTEIALAGPFYFAEDYHQQYLEQNPDGYCPDHGTGVACPIGLGVRAERATGRHDEALGGLDQTVVGDRG